MVGEIGSASPKRPIHKVSADKHFHFESGRTNRVCLYLLPDLIWGSTFGRNKLWKILGKINDSILSLWCKTQITDKSGRILILTHFIQYLRDYASWESQRVYITRDRRSDSFSTYILPCEKCWWMGMWMIICFSEIIELANKGTIMLYVFNIVLESFPKSSDSLRVLQW